VGRTEEGPKARPVSVGGTKKPPQVSVVLPTHNRPLWLRTALESVLEGEFQDLEVIVSNNGRHRHTRELAKEISDFRVRWVEQPPCGPLEHLLAAFALTRGRYVALLHDDDWWHPRLLATLVPPLEGRPDAVLAFVDQAQVSVVGEIDVAATDYFSQTSGRTTLTPGFHQPFDYLAVREGVSNAGFVFRRESLALADIPLELGTAYDLWIPYLLARTGGAAYYCPDRLVYVRWHANSVLAEEPMANLLSAVDCQRRMLRDPRLEAHYGELRHRLAAREHSIGTMLLRQGSRSAAREHLLTALRVRATLKGGAAWAASWIAPRSLLERR
jgi:glycosyltransferase involved in cell wall biosynthesis